MGICSDPPPPPDYTPIANASSEAAKIAAEQSQKQLDWAKEQWAQNKATSDKVVDSFMKTMDENSKKAKEDRARYEGVYQPLEDSLVRDAESYSSESRKQLEAGRAEANVAQQFEGARQAATRNLESFGVDPTSTRYAALDLGVRTNQAAAQAAAGNAAIDNVDKTGRALRSEAINIGRGLPGQIAGQYATSMGAGQGAAGTGNQTTATGAATMGTGTQWAGVQNGALGTWSNALSQGYAGQMAAYNAQDSGLGAILGLAASTATKIPGFAEGGSVPEGASPTRGSAIDDVPAQLTAGEFVVPKDVVSWYGEKHMHSLIEKADKERAQAQERSGAVPDVGPPTGAPPAFVSRPQRSAVPMG